ncbi:amidase signature domain-containing protein [Lipomyces orientalis]|uniref:Amidase signature domain-containing protein n=1 Tax=Lipomyces orientalis TaxID=1233043 RepID=A0ACC3TTZ0_9ASCO
MFTYLKYKKIIATKQKERADRIAELIPVYGTPLTSEEVQIFRTPVAELVTNVHKGVVKPIDVLHAYGKRALKAQENTNCLTEIMFKDAEKQAEICNTHGSLAGVPISFKDTVSIKGYDCTLGIAMHAFKPLQNDAPLVRLLKDAGALPYCKTNIPMTLLSYESYNNIWGRTENPHVKGFTPGGSSGGEAALLAYGGGRVGMGTDVAGSVRVPSHFAGCYTVRSSFGRIPRAGNSTPTRGQDGITSIYSPMTRSFDDLEYVFKAIIDMKPWEYDYTVHPIPWRDVALPKKLKIGVMYSDGVVDPSPACARALQLTVDALAKQGHEIVTFTPPSPVDALRIATQLIVADAGRVATSQIAWCEPYDKGVTKFLRIARLPRFIKKIWAWLYLKFKGDTVIASLLSNWNEKTMPEHMGLVWEREGYRAQYFSAWKTSGIDFLITAPNATPALPHDGMFQSFASIGYAVMFNLVDYSSGVIPVTKVDKDLDALPATFNLNKLNYVAKGAYRNYNAERMHGLPVGVQIVGPRLEEEKVLKMMALTISALKDIGVEYELLNEV